MDNISVCGEKCTGCGFCSFVCPTKAITLSVCHKNNYFIMPIVDNSKCISCGKCLSKCPSNSNYIVNNNVRSFLFINRSKHKKSKFSSGGFFTALAEYILENDGVVYGAGWDEFLHVRHMRVNSLDKLNILQKSKYIQSFISNDIYFQLQKDVSDGKIVLFSGTPCQCASVFNLFNEIPSNLFVCDVICHGVPNQWSFDQWRSFEETKTGGSLISFDFRFKKRGFKTKLFSYQIARNNSFTSIVGSPQFNPFFSAYQKNCNYRNSCYLCSYRKPRVFSDFTMGDFYGIENVTKRYKNSSGKSLVFVNSNKAYKTLHELSLFNTVREYPFDLCKNLSTAYLHNDNPNKRDPLFYEKWEDTSYINNYCNPYSKLKAIKTRFLNFIKLFLRLLNIKVNDASYYLSSKTKKRFYGKKQQKNNYSYK